MFSEEVKREIERRKERVTENEGDETLRESKEWEGKSMQIGGNAVVSLCWLITGACPIF